MEADLYCLDGTAVSKYTQNLKREYKKKGKSGKNEMNKNQKENQNVFEYKKD